MIGTYVLSAGYYDAYYVRAQKVRSLIKRDFDEAFAAGVDAVLTPATPSTAFAQGEKGSADPVEMYLNDVFTVTVNMAGLPGIAVPGGLAANGLPLGLAAHRPPLRRGDAVLARRGARAGGAEDRLPAAMVARGLTMTTPSAEADMRTPQQALQDEMSDVAPLDRRARRRARRAAREASATDRARREGEAGAGHSRARARARRRSAGARARRLAPRGTVGRARDDPVDARSIEWSIAHEERLMGARAPKGDAQGIGGRRTL